MSKASKRTRTSSNNEEIVIHHQITDTTLMAYVGTLPSEDEQMTYMERIAGAVAEIVATENLNAAFGAAHRIIQDACLISYAARKE